VIHNVVASADLVGRKMFQVINFNLYPCVGWLSEKGDLGMIKGLSKTQIFSLDDCVLDFKKP
jgi:hypothetical protein